ncbi:hypothetical protein BRADI_3g28358v3 [Brachypodium distachyon]|uniref:DUF7597 domain-containing protein n=1 Tax=Brachypodium distachyon TaxID=15368 RepID=A0A0Q3Q5X1_BRADI|nr:hypothetical protein BRADI_3g28358v3 [Brachypodium distachyon]
MAATMDLSMMETWPLCANKGKMAAMAHSFGLEQSARDPEASNKDGSAMSGDTQGTTPLINRHAGINLSHELWRRWHQNVTVPASARPDFFMVASFGRCKFRLSEISVANLLNACLGGIPEEFRVVHLRDHTYRFSVTSRFIGFHIAKLLSFTCAAFVVYFHLWGFGEPNYEQEFVDRMKEEDDSWQSPKLFTGVLAGANKVPIGRKSAFARLGDHYASLSPWSNTKEAHLADCGYSEGDIGFTKQDYLRRYRAHLGVENTVPCTTVFDRLRFPELAQRGDSSVFRRIQFPPSLKKMTGTNSVEPNGHRNDDGNEQNIHFGTSIPIHQDNNSRPGFESQEESQPFLTLMANFPVNPAMFLLGLYDIVEVAERPQQRRYHLASRDVAKNEDMAIGTIAPPLPLDEPFMNISGIVRALLEDHLRIHVDTIERCPLGDAYVRVMSASVRDWLVSNSPHQHNDRVISFTEHNKGINWRSFSYNQEAWLMLLAFPFDIWTFEHVANAVADWGRMVHWDKTASTLARIIIKVRVADLSHIPFSIVITDGDDVHGESWIVLVFILSQKLLGGQPQDEDAPPPYGATPHPLPALEWHDQQPDNFPANHALNPKCQMVDQNIVQNLPQVQAMAEDNPQLQDLLAYLDDLNDDSEITVTISSNAPDVGSEGSSSVNMLPQINNGLIVG